MIFFNELAELWITGKSKTISHSSYTKYQNIINKYLLPYFESVKLQCMEADNVLAEIEQIFQTHPDISDQTKINIYMIMNNILAFGYKENILSSEIKISYGRKRPAQNKIDFFSEEESKLLSNYLLLNKCKRNLAILLSLCLGLRIGELCALQYKDFSTDTKTICISKRVERTKDRTTGKTHLEVSELSDGLTRTIPVPGYIATYVENLSFEYAGSQYMFSADNSSPLDPRTLQYYYKKLLGELDIPYKKFQTLRYTFIIRSINAGWTERELKLILGKTFDATPFYPFCERNDNDVLLKKIQNSI